MCSELQGELISQERFINNLELYYTSIFISAKCH